MGKLLGKLLGKALGKELGKDLTPGFSGVSVTTRPQRTAGLVRSLVTNKAAFVVAGTVVAGSGWTNIHVDAYRNGSFEQRFSGAVAANAFSINCELIAELASRNFKVLAQNGTVFWEVDVIEDIVAGDAHYGDGQSNELALMYHDSSAAERSPWVRTYGHTELTGSAVAADQSWYHATGDSVNVAGPGHIGQWALKCFHTVAVATGIPQFFINNAIGGFNIALMTRNPAALDDVNTHYGKLHLRSSRAGFLTSYRSRSFCQGEADDASPGATYAAELVQKFGWWENDYNAAATIESNVIIQTRRISASAVAANEHRKCEGLFAETTVVASNGIDGHDGLHYYFANGYEELGLRVARVILRDVYGVAQPSDTKRIMPVSASYAADKITVVLDHNASSISVNQAIAANFVITGAVRTILSMAIVSGNLEITLAAGGGTPTGIQYLGSFGAGNPWIKDANGNGLLSFILTIP